MLEAFVFDYAFFDGSVDPIEIPISTGVASQQEVLGHHPFSGVRRGLMNLPD